MYYDIKEIPEHLKQYFEPAPQIGLEATPAEFVQTMVEVFGEVRRVMRSDGTLFLNLGDSYANDAKWGGSSGEKNYTSKLGGFSREKKNTGFKPKDLMMIPHRVAIALQDAGWWVRQDIVEEVELYCPCGCEFKLEERIWRHSPDREIIWKKPNPMPESVTDRCTKAHEYIFHLTKSEIYFFDSFAIQEPQVASERARQLRAQEKGIDTVFNIARDSITNLPNQSQTGAVRSAAAGQALAVRGTRNKRSVWNISTKPYSEAHFATFPKEIPETCIKAGTSERGCCASCGTPFKREVEKELIPTAKASFNTVADFRDFTADKNDQGSNRVKDGHKPGWINDTTTLGFSRSCACASAEAEPCIVLDPFAGAGTTLIVAKRLGRKAIGIELNPEYCQMIVNRIKEDSMPLFD